MAGGVFSALSTCGLRVDLRMETISRSVSLRSFSAMICWNAPTHAPRLPSQYSVAGCGGGALGSLARRSRYGGGGGRVDRARQMRTCHGARGCRRGLDSGARAVAPRWHEGK